jgi:hypothetical protein
MSAGSGASNFGYSNVNPYNTSPYVNGTSSSYAGGFGSNEIPGPPGLAGAKINTDAAAWIVPGICTFKGGAKRLKQKIKNITKRYKMKGGKKSRKQVLRKRIMSRSIGRTLALAGGRRRRRRSTRRRSMKGGYAQFQNNQPFSMGYSVGGVLGSGDLALANPPPIQAYNSAIDNYNHYTNKGFPSPGH